MLSLANAFSLEDMDNFLKKINNFLNFDNKKLNYFVNQKLMEFLQH